MTKLNAKGRAHVKGKNFGLPGERKYPIHDITNARVALAMVAKNGTPAQQKAVRVKVAKKFPSIGKK